MADRRVALVTGASRGIGEATARELAARGYALGITSIEPAELGAVAKELIRRGTTVFSLAGDLGDLDFVKTFAEEAGRALGPAHVLVNNAAWREQVTMREISTESWERTLRVSLTAPAFLARWAAEQMEPLKRGVIINVSSMMSTHATGISPAYIAAKGGLDALTYDLAALYGRSGIRVVAINPGAVDTPMSWDSAGTREDALAKKTRDWSEQMISLGRWSTGEEIARTIAWLAGDEASYVTGTTIVVDGGWGRQLYPHDLKRELKPGQFP